MVDFVGECGSLVLIRGQQKPEDSAKEEKASMFHQIHPNKPPSTSNKSPTNLCATSMWTLFFAAGRRSMRLCLYSQLKLPDP